MEREQPLSISKVKIVCPKCGKSTGVGKKFIGEGDRDKVRVCKKCGEILDKV